MHKPWDDTVRQARAQHRRMHTTSISLSHPWILHPGSIIDCGTVSARAPSDLYTTTLVTHSDAFIHVTIKIARTSRTVFILAHRSVPLSGSCCLCCCFISDTIQTNRAPYGLPSLSPHYLSVSIAIPWILHSSSATHRSFSRRVVGRARSRLLCCCVPIICTPDSLCPGLRLSRAPCSVTDWYVLFSVYFARRR